jgi:hypothetical protein
VRLQWWADYLDHMLRRKYAEKLKATPHPKILVRKSTEPNAWVSAIPVAWDVKTRVAGGPPDLPVAPPGDAGVDGDVDGGASEAGAPAPIPPAGDLTLVATGAVYTGGWTPAFARPHDAAKLASFVHFHNENFAKCRMEATAEGVVFSELCTPPGGAGLENRRGEKLAYYATATYVTFTTAYIQRLLAEDRIVSTMAHELGHFYRSHINMPSDVLNYFYSLDNPHAHQPPPDARYIEQTAKVRAKIREQGWQTDYTEENTLMRERRLGFYTQEQEADEIALEILANSGIAPSVAIDKIFDNLKMAEEMGGELDPNAIKYAECMMLREQGWKDAEGKPVSVPVGDPVNAHHNSCFRAFNMAREINAHRYEVAMRPSTPPPAWTEVLAKMNTDLAAPPAPPAGLDAGADANAPPVAADAGTDGQ